jgi:hypothetical protein
VPVIGYIGAGKLDATSEVLRAFHRGLSETGYVEGKNVAVEYRWAEDRLDRLPALAADLVHRKVAVIFAASPRSALAAKTATGTIPIVFLAGNDPVRLGLVASLARPEGNLTGISAQNVDLAGKRFELLREVVPALRRLAILFNVNNPNAALEIDIVRKAAGPLGLCDEVEHIEGLAHRAKAVELEADLLVHGVASIEAHHHGNSRSDRVEELRQLRAREMHETRGDDHQRHRRLEQLAETITKAVGHANSHSVLEALQADRLGQRTIPIDHQHACHGIPFRIDFGTSEKAANRVPCCWMRPKCLWFQAVTICAGSSIRQVRAECPTNDGGSMRPCYPGAGISIRPV